MADADRALTETLARFGLDSLTSQPSLCRNTLRDKLPENPRETALLVTALEAGVPNRLRTESRISGVETVAAQLADGLEHSYGLSPESARWAVDTLAAALDLSGVETVPNRTPGAPVEGATVLRTPGQEQSAPPPAPTESPLAETPQPVTSAPGAGEGTVLRPDAVGGGSTPPVAPSIPPPTATPPAGPKGDGRRGRWLAIAAVVVVVGALAATLAIVLGGSGNKPSGAAGHSSSSHTSAAPPAGNRSSSAATSSSAANPDFAEISPVLAHRGDHEGYPQETLPAFVQAAQRGFTVETDIRWTSDGVPIINHDLKTGLGMVCTGGPYEVAKTTWAVLQANCRTPASAAITHKSYGIPTFESTVQTLSKISGSTLFAELKTDQTPSQNAKYLGILRKYGMLTRTVATCFYSNWLADFNQEVAKEKVSIRTLRFAAAAQPTTVADLQRVHVWGVVFLEPWSKIPTLIASARQAGIQVGVGTTATPTTSDDATAWANAKRLGAEFVLTDKPKAFHDWFVQH